MKRCPHCCGNPNQCSWTRPTTLFVREIPSCLPLDKVVPPLLEVFVLFWRSELQLAYFYACPKRGEIRETPIRTLAHSFTDLRIARSFGLWIEDALNVCVQVGLRSANPRETQLLTPHWQTRRSQESETIQVKKPLQVLAQIRRWRPE